MYAKFYKNLSGACGTFTVHDFGYLKGAEWAGMSEVTLENLKKFSSIGVCYAGFQAGEKDSDDMFKLLSEICTPVYVSPVRVNPNSNNKFYFAVFEIPGFEDKDIV